MFNKKKESNLQKEQKAGSINIVGDGTEIQGNLTTTSDIRIDGKIIGNVNSKAKVVVGVTGEVVGNIYSQSAELSGNVFGNIQSTENLFLKSTSRVNGDIIATKLVIENGAEFTGYCKTGSAEPISIYDSKTEDERRTGRREEATA